MRTVGSIRISQAAFGLTGALALFNFAMAWKNESILQLACGIFCAFLAALNWTQIP